MRNENLGDSESDGKGRGLEHISGILTEVMRDIENRHRQHQRNVQTSALLREAQNGTVVPICRMPRKRRERVEAEAR